MMFITDEERRIVHKLVDRFVDIILDAMEECEYKTRAKKQEE